MHALVEQAGPGEHHGVIPKSISTRSLEHEAQTEAGHLSGEGQCRNLWTWPQCPECSQEDVQQGMLSDGATPVRGGHMNALPP